MNTPRNDRKYRGRAVKVKTYLMHIGRAESDGFDTVSKVLGWNIIETVRRLLQIFVPIVKHLKDGRELVVSIREETTKAVIIEKTGSYDFLIVKHKKA